MQASHLLRLAGGCLIAGFDGDAADADLLRRIRTGLLGGVILFQRNITGLDQLLSLNVRLVRAAAGRSRFFIAVDQEGGRVARLKTPCTVLPTARIMTRQGRPSLTERGARFAGGEIKALGFNLDFAPVLDISDAPDRSVIGDRSFGTDPQIAARYGLAFCRGLARVGVIPCAKHFPGHGCAVADSHFELPVVDKKKDDLLMTDIAPFAAAARARVPALMSAHVIYTALDPAVPSTLSRKILVDLLRGKLGFKGVLFSDDLGMAAIASRWSAAEAAVMSIAAGADALLVCAGGEQEATARDALASEALRSPSFKSRLVEASSRLDALGRVRPEPRPEAVAWILSKRHQDASRRLLDCWV